MASTEAQRTALQNAINSGVLTATTPDGKSVTYRSLDEMRSILAELTREAQSAASREPSSFVCGYKRDS